jgi:hypothetical protein
VKPGRRDEFPAVTYGYGCAGAEYRHGLAGAGEVLEIGVTIAPNAYSANPLTICKDGDPIAVKPVPSTDMDLKPPGMRTGLLGCAEVLDDTAETRVGTATDNLPLQVVHGVPGDAR